jgi:predicted RNA-binding Zn-ribbon protein involved in translation (DUF1610 family)
LSDRKYRQPGYQDRGEDRSQPRQEKPKPKDMTFGPRTINMAPTRTVSRCAQCGVVLPALGDLAGQCPKCGFELHSCKQCTHFDPASRFECRQPVPQRVARKDTRNDCQFFSIKVAVEKETGSARADDARRAFENLFRKI